MRIVPARHDRNPDHARMRDRDPQIMDRSAARINASA